MVKRNCNCKYQATTPDLVKISSPKAHDDPFGSSSPRLASDCPGQSNFRGFTPDSTVITSPKTRDKPYGSLLSRGWSDVLDRADFLSISWFFLGCYTNRFTAASMVNTHSLCAWNSLTLEDVSSVSVHLMHLTSVNAIDLMADFVMEWYALFPGLVELIVPPGVILPYGSLSRPQENCFASCSWRIYSDMVCDSLFLFAKYIDSGMIFVDSGIWNLAGDVIVAFWHLECRYALREGELWLDDYRHLEHLVFQLRVYAHLVSRECNMYCLMLLSPLWMLTRLRCLCCSSREAASEVCLHVHKLLFAASVMHLVAQQTFLQVTVHCRRTKFYGPGFTTTDELRLKQSLPHVLQRQRRMLLARSGWFISILELLYCSLPRPPEVPCDSC
ncbi:unnamed protein product [Arabis nemorensis]|uniref:Uncharacterized protein n=1 Tax=Arabis nemorensis TaxID=586526 RepID=A0A565BDK7_9BRAS|nr:unnamed protein product [Arabis nemorensis]